MGLVSVVEAAKFLGVSEETIKRRIRRGELTGQQHPRPQGYAWMVELPDEVVDTTPQDDSTTTRNDNTVHHTNHHTEHAEKAAEIRRLDQLVAVLQHQLQLNQEELESRRREVQELHVLLQQSQAALPAPKEQQRRWWRRLLGR